MLINSNNNSDRKEIEQDDSIKPLIPLLSNLFFEDKRWLDLVFHTSVNEIANKKSLNNLISIDSHTTVGDTMVILKNNNIFSAPIFKENCVYNSQGQSIRVDNGGEGDDWENKHYLSDYIGMLGVHEIIAFMIGIFFEEKTSYQLNYSPYSTSETIEIETWKLPKPKDISKNSQFFKDTPILDLLNLAPPNPRKMDYIFSTDNMAMAIKVLSESKLTRLPIVKDNTIIGILSRTDILSKLVSNKQILPEIFHKPLSYFPRQHLLDSDYWSIYPDTTASFAFHIMEKKEKQSVAIVKDKQLVSNFSLTDIKGIDESNILDLNLEIKDYLEKINKSIDKNKIVSATLNTSLIDVIQLIVQHKIHGLWILRPTNQDSNHHDEIEGFISYKSILDIINNLIKLL
ncbi:hypothetical protein CYY_007275 [Polysphondylium violaceum]|uniref:CBS domain-containing protein n=1 Tax=Polysphondylium violaceum TaxID=133409 RepID=A0A8J4PXS4_9MYCE|nr:hypothetical protein CYY_007275 [Polysphondylium violaceum]